MRGKFKEHQVDFPEEGLIFDYAFNIENNEWQKWLDTAPEYSVDLKWSYNEIVVPTPDSIRMKYLIKLLITHKKHVLTPGPTGTGKSVNISDLLTYELPEEF
jgi:dynein heavy chain